MALRILSDPSLVSFLRGATVVLCIASTGCSAAFYGIKPDPNDFRKEGLAYCQQLHADPKERNACIDYEDTVRSARALENAYLTRERVNRWGIFVGTTIALASVGALTGLYAFGQAASDAAKIIPIAGTFAGSVIAYLSNDAKADAYEDARYEVGRARAQAEAIVLPDAKIGRDASQYNRAQSQLNDKINTIEESLAQRIRAGRPSTAEVLKQTANLKKDNALLVFAGKYRVTDVHPNVPLDPTQISITLTQNIEPDDQKLLVDNGVVRIGEFDVKLSSAAIDGAKVTVAIPVSVKQGAGVGAGPKLYGVAMKIGAYLLNPVKTVTLSYP